jgi:Ca2+-binding EF-hand superfamily protein
MQFRDGLASFRRLIGIPKSSGLRGDQMSKVILAALALTLTAANLQATEPYFPRKETSFMRLDMNKDGKLEQNEFNTAALRRFSRFDANSDKTVTTAEVDQLLQKGFEKRKARYLALMDRDRDGAITQDELDNVVSSMFAEADADRDGGLTMAEIQGFKRGAWARRMIDGKVSGGAN